MWWSIDIRVLVFPAAWRNNIYCSQWYLINSAFHHVKCIFVDMHHNLLVIFHSHLFVHLWLSNDLVYQCTLSRIYPTMYFISEWQCRYVKNNSLEHLHYHKLKTVLQLGECPPWNCFITQTERCMFHHYHVLFILWIWW